MRQLKFRAWEEERKLMFEPVVMDLMIDFKGDVFSVDIDGYKPVTDLRIMQYTGLKDMSSQEVYEGDIVSFEDAYYSTSENGQEFEVFQNKGVIEYCSEELRYF